MTASSTSLAQGDTLLLVRSTANGNLVIDGEVTVTRIARTNAHFVEHKREVAFDKVTGFVKDRTGITRHVMSKEGLEALEHRREILKRLRRNGVTFQFATVIDGLPVELLTELLNKTEELMGRER